MAVGATGTPTTNFAIPKYATGADAPNGTGFNSAMDFIDNLLQTEFIPAPSGLVVGSVPVWDGDSWEKPSGSPDGTKFLRDDGAWATPTVAGVNTGMILPFAGFSAPANFLWCDGTAYAKATYAALWAAIATSKGTFTVTIASPAVVTLASHGFQGGERVYLTTTGALPTGLTADTDYWVIPVDATTFRLASSVTNYLAGTAINTSGSQSGTHTLVYAPYGVSGASNFAVPDLRGRVPVGHAGTGGKSLVKSMGLHDDRTQANRSISHFHDYQRFNNGSASFAGPAINMPTGENTTPTTGDANNREYPAFQVVGYIIKT